MYRACAAAALLLSIAGSQSFAASPNPASRAAVYLAREIGPRPAASGAERRAHRWVAQRFRRGGLAVTYTRFRVPGKGRSRNVVGSWDGPRRCLKIVMAHIDSVPAGPGANDNASGVGVLVGLAGRLERVEPFCDIWLVATGAEERPYTGSADHLGSRRLVKYVRRQRSVRRLRYALSLDMVGRGGKFQLRSPQSAPRRGIERQVLAAGRRRGVRMRWLRDADTGNSDHREFELGGLPGLAMQQWGDLEPCWHQPCDTWRRLQPRSLARAQDIAELVLGRR